MFLHKAFLIIRLYLVKLPHANIFSNKLPKIKVFFLQRRYKAEKNLKNKNVPLSDEKIN